MWFCIVFFTTLFLLLSPTMIRYGYKNIRDLIGPKIDLNMIYKAPLCRMYKC